MPIITTTEYPQGRAAPTGAEIHPLIAHRWSPRAFSERRVESEKLLRILEAARWAPSSYNEQPWRFMVATVDDPDWLERLRGYLTKGNAWARRAPVLMFSAYRAAFTKTGKTNRVAMRDLGAAEQNMVLEAYHQGLIVHQMQGFDHGAVKEELLPEGFEPGAATAVGYPGDLAELSQELRERERAPRKRKPLDEIVFGSGWGEPPRFL